jgi:hypothetical protein
MCRNAFILLSVLIFVFTSRKQVVGNLPGLFGGAVSYRTWIRAATKLAKHFRVKVNIRTTSIEISNSILIIDRRY